MILVPFDLSCFKDMKQSFILVMSRRHASIFVIVGYFYIMSFFGHRLCFILTLRHVDYTAMYLMTFILISSGCICSYNLDAAEVAMVYCYLATSPELTNTPELV